METRDTIFQKSLGRECKAPSPPAHELSNVKPAKSFMCPFQEQSRGLNFYFEWTDGSLFASFIDSIKWIAMSLA